MLVALASFVAALVVVVRSLETRLADARRTIEVLNQKIGTHRAVYAWLDACEQREQRVVGSARRELLSELRCKEPHLLDQR